MEPLKATNAWDSYTPVLDELLQHNGDGVVQVVQGALSEVVDTQLGAMVDYQGTFLSPGDSLTVVQDVEVNFRQLHKNKITALGRNPR